MFVVPVLPPMARRRESRLPKSLTSAMKLGMFSELVLYKDKMGRYCCIIIGGGLTLVSCKGHSEDGGTNCPECAHILECIRRIHCCR